MRKSLILKQIKKIDDAVCENKFHEIYISHFMRNEEQLGNDQEHSKSLDSELINCNVKKSGKKGILDFLLRKLYSIITWFNRFFRQQIIFSE